MLFSRASVLLLGLRAVTAAAERFGRAFAAFTAFSHHGPRPKTLWYIVDKRYYSPRQLTVNAIGKCESNVVTIQT